MSATRWVPAHLLVLRCAVGSRSHIAYYKRGDTFRHGMARQGPRAPTRTHGARRILLPAEPWTSVAEDFLAFLLSLLADLRLNECHG